MFSRFTVIVVSLLLLTLPAMGTTSLYPLGDEILSAAAVKARAGDAAGALAAARGAKPSGARDFFIGMMSYRLEKWMDAAENLAAAETKFPVLADYALFHLAGALHKTGRSDDALAALRRLQKDHAESQFVRQAALLEADVLYGKRDFAGATAAYMKFVEKYASGNDAIAALYKAAGCREESGDVKGAATVYRNIWLNNPASSYASQADEQLKRLAAAGTKTDPFTADELIRRANTLFDLKNFNSAADAFEAIPRTGLTEETITRINLKAGQALFRARKYAEAEQTLAAAVPAVARQDLKDETSYWLGRALDKNGKQDEAVRRYLALAEATPASAVADDALFDAALIRKYQGKEVEAIALMEKLVQTFPTSQLARRATWEAAWTRYLLKEYKTAAQGFLKLKDQEDYREKALYWHARAAQNSGDAETATASVETLLKEFPLGFYALQYKREKGIQDQFPLLPENAVTLFPVPQGYERVKALIALGMPGEAAKELAAVKKKNGKRQKDYNAGMARLYLEMGNFNGASALYRGEKPARVDRDGMQAWGASYPLAFRDLVDESARASSVSSPLVYSVMKAESSFEPTAKSPAGAIGLMQLMPATAKSMEAENGGQGALVTPRINIRLGTRHLKDVLAVYKGNAALAAAAYNAGAANVNKWRKNFGHLPQMEFIENIPYPETREYVKKVLAGAEIYSRLYGIRDETFRSFKGYSTMGTLSQLR